MKQVILCLVGLFSVQLIQAQIVAPEIKVEDTGNRIGIGVSSPGQDIQLRGNTIMFENENGQAQSWFPYLNGEVYLTSDKDGSGSGRIHFRTFKSSEGHKDRMIIDGDGKVGIGTTAINNNLSIFGSNSGISQTIGLGTIPARGWVIEAGPLGDYNTTGHYPLIFRRLYTTSTVNGDFVVEARNGKDFVIDVNGNVGIGTVSPGHALTVVGSTWCTSGAWVNSDAKTKKNIKEYHKGLDVVAQLHPIQYELKAGTDSVTLYQNNIPIGKKPRPLVSVMAQELQSVAPELVETYLDEQAEETLSINQTGLLFVLMNAIKELDAKVVEQQQLIEALQKVEK